VKISFDLKNRVIGVTRNHYKKISHCQKGRKMFLSPSEEFQKVKEYLDNVDVDGECPKDILLFTQLVLLSSHKQLCIIDKIHAENQHTQTSIHDICCIASENCCKEAKYHEANKNDKEIRPHSSEIKLCLERENGES